MRIVGIDPGLATTGWAVVDFDGREIVEVVNYGVVETKKGLDTGVRLGEIYSDLCEILEEFKPEVAGVEILIFCNNAKTAMKVGEARGVALLALNTCGVELHEYTPLQVKSSICGYGQAKKRQVQENVQRMCNLSSLPEPDDAADAIALAICCNDSIVLNNVSNLKNTC
jgi:crossover junction endodeoxyribonuclease RuvC